MAVAISLIQWQKVGGGAHAPTVPTPIYGERRLYSKLLLLQAVTSVATEQTPSFLAS